MLRILFVSLIINIILFLPLHKSENYSGSIISGTLNCVDGRVVKLQDAANFDCGVNVGAYLHLRVGFKNGGFEEVVGMAPYWPVYIGDCWPTTNSDGKRSICN